MLPANVATLLEAFGNWSQSRPDIKAVALVGSYARAEGSESSDIDLVILASNVYRYLGDRSWIAAFGEFSRCQQEDYGRVTSVRAFYQSGLEVEYGFATRDWAASPIDAGTLKVVIEGSSRFNAGLSD